MTDPYANIRRALAMGPTPGPWRCEHETGGGHDCWMIYAGDWPESGGIVGYYTHTGPRHLPHVRPNIEAVAIAHHIAACDPDTIRELLAERDQLAAALEAAREDADKLRETLRTVSAVGIVQLFNTARDDVLAEFNLAELQEISRVTEHKRPEQVERIYREGWDAAIDQARGKGGGEVG